MTQKFDPMESAVGLLLPRPSFASSGLVICGSWLVRFAVRQPAAGIARAHRSDGIRAGFDIADLAVGIYHECHAIGKASIRDQDAVVFRHFAIYEI